MRTREEIWREKSYWSGVDEGGKERNNQFLILEVLLDIRDLLSAK